MRALAATSLSLLLIPILASPALAAWPNSAFTNVAQCTAPGDQLNPRMVSDGAGGAIMTWEDRRSGPDADIYAQHVMASGAVDPAWPVNGLALCTALNNQLGPTIVSDGAGGAIVAWADSRTGAIYDIYAQHVLASGTVDPAWPADGLPVCTAPNLQYSPSISTDGAGGAIVSWQDFRNGSNNDIYAQHLLASGTVDPAWPADGRALCLAPNSQFSSVSVPDGAGGAIVAWADNRSGAFSDIYVQHIQASGVVDPAWPVNGLALCIAANNQSSPALVPDGAGGAIVTWYDLRGGTTADIYAQHVLASGSADPAWPANGRALCTAVGDQFAETIVPDGSGGAIVAWNDVRAGTNYDIYAQHVQASGAVDPGWPTDGRAVCTAANNQQNPTLASDGYGGAFVAWSDPRTGSADDIYAEHLLASGFLDPAWPSNGRFICGAAGYQSLPMIVTDGSGGAIVCWQDQRNGSNYDIYAQKLEAYGRLGNPEPVIVSVRDVPFDNGGHVKVSWLASYLDAPPFIEINNYEVWRSIPAALATARLRAGSRLVGLAGAPARSHAGAIFTSVEGAKTTFWEYVGSQPARRFAGYSYDLSTTGDSIGAGIPTLQVLILAVDKDGYSQWASAGASGYSVDNLPPAAPAPLTGQFVGGTTHLHWNRNIEADLAGYRLYRGASVGFVPGPGNLVASLADTGFADPAGLIYVYKLTAVDIHGNESPVATLTPTAATGVSDRGAPRELSFAAPSPNPAGAATTLRFALPHASRVRLSIYDAAGRLVRELVSGPVAAGEHSEPWNLKDAGGRSAGAGLYFARLEADGRVLVRRMTVVR